MNNALFCVGAQVTFDNNAGTDATVFSGDSLTMLDVIRDKPGANGRLFMFDYMVYCPTAVGIFKLKGARTTFHDSKDGLVNYIQLDTVNNFLKGELVEVVPGDVLTPNIKTADAAGDINNVVMNFLAKGDFAIAQRLISYNEFQRRKKEPINLYTTVTAGTTAGYGGSQAFSSFTLNNMEKEDLVAILGATSTVLQAALVINGPDTGYRNIAIPGMTQYQDNEKYFLGIAATMPDEPLIPVISGNNLGLTTLKTVNDENAASPIVTIYGRRIN